MSGLYDPATEHDACGLGFVARLDGRPSRETIRRALHVLDNLEHRGAAGADPDTGDGAGILIQMPHVLLRATAPAELPPPGEYGVASVFLPQDKTKRAEHQAQLQQQMEAAGLEPLGWRDVEVDSSIPGKGAAECEPVAKQLFIGIGDEVAPGDAFERRLYLARRRAELAEPELEVVSCSSRTLIYKGMLTAPQLHEYYADLGDPRIASALAVVHSRFSTNTFPSWGLAHPYRMIAHNGEINTVRGNVNWMRARERALECHHLGTELEQILPVVRPGSSDSQAFDNVLELLVQSGRSLPHSVMMMVPEAWEGRDDIPPVLKDFYEFHAGVMEPWDGPAAVIFSDGRIVGATLDRNGLRPGRWSITNDGWVVLASETGAYELPADTIVNRGRLEPGSLFVVDVENGLVHADREAELEVAESQPWGRWTRTHTVSLDDLPLPELIPREHSPGRRERLRRAFGYTGEDLRVTIGPTASTGKEPNGSMGNDAALPVLSDKRPPLFTYFKQLFAQVTNPAIDPVREDVVMSLRTTLSGYANVLEAGAQHAHHVVLDTPILDYDGYARLRAMSRPPLLSAVVDTTWRAETGVPGMAAALERIQHEASTALDEGYTVVVLSDRRTSAERVAIPSLLATSAVHHHLVRTGARLNAGLVVDSGEPREVHHFATLIGYGATAVHPYALLDAARDLVAVDIVPNEDGHAAIAQRTVKALSKGLLKIMSKMGISTISSYRGAQIFEAVGLDPELIDRHFTGTPSRVGGVGLVRIAEDALAHHAAAFGGPEVVPEVGGRYVWRKGGERHAWNPETIVSLQRAVRGDGDWETFAKAADAEAAEGTLRGLLRVKPAGAPIPIDEVEPPGEIVRRFATGAMSLGSISPETHETLARAMNALGGKSNTGEGGEDPERFADDRRSSIKQVASARFGVTIGYLVNADELQIKICQGSKPGEGGQLPGGKVDKRIAELRFSTPGVELISPPPHHDIYSIEDLKQLIYDLRCAHPKARISVKLAAEHGVGTVAAGVVKAHSDHVVIAGHDGGTGASALSSVHNAGVPWELGLSETHQVLVRNGLRERVVLQVDGQMKTGRDVIVGALLGAEEFGFSTAPLIALGCIMMRVCHLNTCPVGIATQDPLLRRKFEGQPEHVTNYFAALAQDVRERMAALGVARFEDLIGRADLLEADPDSTRARERKIDLADLLHKEPGPHRFRPSARPSESGIADALDHELVAEARGAIEHGTPVALRKPVTNVNRAVGALLSGEIARRHGASGLPDATIEAVFTGSAGQSFGAWLAPGVSFVLLGDANDYTGKGLSGGTLAVAPPADAAYEAADSAIVGNTVLYGATSGRAFFSGRAGERFAVRNSGARAVVERVGDHGCEYMTGGRVAVLGRTGRNFGAGMSGGIAWVYDEDGRFARRCNRELVDLERVTRHAGELHELVSEHLDRTGSLVAARLLADWPIALARFVQVMPRDYRRAIEREEPEPERTEATAPEPAASEAALR